MSLNAIESIFWGFGDNPAKLKAFLKDPDGYLAQFPLTEAERKMVRTMNAKALYEHGVSTMLILPAWTAAHGGNSLMIFDYLKHLNDGKMINKMKLPGWQFNMLRAVLGVRNAWVGVLCSLGLKKRLG